MNTELLLKLATLLRALPEIPDREGLSFNLAHWNATGGARDHAGHPCGTTACAVGYAALSDQFPGLEMFGGVPAYGKYTSRAAVMVYFGIDGATAEHLFSAESYEQSVRGPKDVAARIEEAVLRRQRRAEAES